MHVQGSQRLLQGRLVDVITAGKKFHILGVCREKRKKKKTGSHSLIFFFFLNLQILEFTVKNYCPKGR